MAPRDGGVEATYVHDGVQVVRYPVPRRSRSAISSKVVRRTRLFDVFQRQLRELNADVFHMHSLTTGSGAPHLACAHELGMRTVMTAHVPGTSARAARCCASGARCATGGSIRSNAYRAGC